MNDNWFLKALSPACREFLGTRLMEKPLHAGEFVHIPEAPLQNLVFPFDGLISLQSEVAGARRIESITVGPDGLLGCESLIGETHSATYAVAVVAGRAGWLPVPDFIQAQQSFPCLQPAVFSAMARLKRRLMQNVACTAVHSAIQRISTWLLHADDRLPRGSFDVTQRILAENFGLRTATVGEACHRLRDEGGIHYSRGKMSLLDRGVLKSYACECYEAVSLAKLDQLLPLR